MGKVNVHLVLIQITVDDCQIKIPFLNEYAIDDDNPFFNFDYLSYQNQMLPPFDDLSNINEIFENDAVYRAIDEQEESYIS